MVQEEMLMEIEMPSAEQLFYFNLHHIGTWNRSHTSIKSHLGSSKRSNNDSFRANAKAHGQYEEFRGISRTAASSKSSLHPFLRYVVKHHIEKTLTLYRRLSYRLDFY